MCKLDLFEEDEDEEVTARAREQAAAAVAAASFNSTGSWASADAPEARQAHVGTAVEANGSNRLIVTDAFGGTLAVLDSNGKLTRQLSFPGHNLRGLAVNKQSGELLIAHQILYGDEHTTSEGIFWGSVLDAIGTEVWPDADSLVVAAGAAIVGLAAGVVAKVRGRWI